MKFMAKIKCPIWQLLATTHAHCHKCGRLALTISYSAPHQSQKSKQSRQVIYSSGFCEFDFYTYSVFRLYSIIFCGLVLFCRFFSQSDQSFRGEGCSPTLSKLLYLHTQQCNSWTAICLPYSFVIIFAFQINHFAFTHKLTQLAINQPHNLAIAEPAAGRHMSLNTRPKS